MVSKMALGCDDMTMIQGCDMFILGVDSCPQLGIHSTTCHLFLTFIDFHKLWVLWIHSQYQMPPLQLWRPGRYLFSTSDWEPCPPPIWDPTDVPLSRGFLSRKIWPQAWSSIRMNILCYIRMEFSWEIQSETHPFYDLSVPPGPGRDGTAARRALGPGRPCSMAGLSTRGLWLWWWCRGGGYMEVSIAMGVPQNRWFIRDNPIKMDDNWGSPYFRKPSYGCDCRCCVDGEI